MQVITVRVKEVYGTKRVYPVCERAICFARISGNKTLSNEVISYIKQLGFDIKLQEGKI